jgi:rod shape-determining protein MreD
VRALISFVVAAIAVIFQITVVDRITFPGGTGPDVVLLTVAALALAGGPLIGALIGFWAGLALDVAPPGSHLVGQNALVFCIVGYACGLLAEEPAREGASEQGHTALFEIAVTALGAVCGEALSALLGAMLSDPRVTWPAIKHVLPVAAAYDVVLAPFVLFAVAAALRLAPARGDRSRPSWSGLAAQAAVPGAAHGAIRHVGTPNPPRLRLSDRSKGEGWIGSLAGHGQGAAVRPAPKREPRLNLGRGGPLAGSPLGRKPPAKREPRLNLGRGGSLTGGTLGAAFAIGGAPVKVKFSARRSEGVLGGSLAGGSVAGSAALRGSRFGRSRMGRSLLGGSVFSRSSPALNRPAPVSRSAPLGRSAFLGRRSWLGWPSSPRLMRPVGGTTAGRTPRFSRGSPFSRLAGARHRSAGSSTVRKSPGRGWLRRTSSRSGAMGKGALGRRTMGRRAFGRGSGRSALSRGRTGGSAPRLRSRRSGPFRVARLHMPHPMTRRKRRTGGYR